ncbi:hypothetical protein ACJU26_15710 (plasmid) [Acidithiobacillus sp. M4-SHS-6]|uniref:hypothetical protein n=1 Tax=Acidithiobacillus sp. M4-SHS-6 TaxID=3383024 RepID=UPI0039BE1EC7
MAVENSSMVVVSAIYGIEGIALALRLQVNEGRENLNYFMLSGFVEALNVLATIVSDAAPELCESERSKLNAD